MADGGRDGDALVPMEPKRVQIRKTHDGGPTFDGHFQTHQWFFVPFEHLDNDDFVALLCLGRLDFVLVPYFEAMSS